MLRKTVMALTVSMSLAASTDQLTAQAHAVDRGSWLLSGTASVTRHRDVGNDFRTFRVDVSPRIGYFVVPHLAVIMNVRLRTASSDAGNSFAWGLGPGIGYYFGGPESRFRPFASARTLFMWDHRSVSDGQWDRDYTSAAWLVSLGSVVMLASQVGVSAELFYQWDRVTVGGTGGAGNEAERFGLQLGIAAFVF